MSDPNRRHSSAFPSDEPATIPPKPPGEATQPPALPGETVTLAPGNDPSRSESTRHVPGYEILGELGRGGMGVVYKARHVGLNRLCALKMILAGGHAGEEELARFRREAEAIARLQHGNIVAVYDIGTHDGKPYFSLEFCSGGSLDRKLNGTPIDPTEAAKLVKTLAEAMHAAHEAKVIHRDLKPANVLLSSPDLPSPPTPLPPGGEGRKTKSGTGKGTGAGTELATPKITDFGLAKKLDESGQTQTGAIMGTPSYMAPEQAEGKKDVGPLADVYALGAILYECLTGRPPFKAATSFDTIMQVVTQEPVPPTQLNPDVPRDLETITLKCLQKQPARRYASAGDLADDLGHYLAGEPIQARPVGILERAWKWVRRHPTGAGLAVASLVAALALVAFFVGQSYQGRLASANAQLEEALDEARNARRREQEQKEQTQQALDRVERYRYFNLINLASRELEGNDLGRTCELLDDCPEALRGWEWFYLRRRAFTPRKTDRSLPAQVLCLSYSPDGQRLAMGLADGSVVVRDEDAFREKRVVIPGHKGAVHAVAFNIDGNTLASAGEDGLVRVVELTNRKGVFRQGDPSGHFQQRHVLKHHKGPVRSVAFSPDGKYLATGGRDGKVFLWETGRPARLLGVQSGWQNAQALAFSGDGRCLACAWSNSTVTLWEVATARELRKLPSVRPGPASCVTWSSDNKRIAVGIDVVGVQGGVVVHDAEGQGKARVLPGNFSVRGMAFDPMNERLALVSNGKVSLWDAKAGKLLATLGSHTGTATSIAFRPDGKVLASAGGQEQGKGEVTLWEPSSMPGPRRLQGHTSHVSSLAFNRDGERLASASFDGRAILWQVETGRPLLTIGQSLKKGYGFLGIALSRDLQRIATCDSAEGLCLHNAGSGAMEKRLETMKGRPVQRVAFRPDSKQLATAGYQAPLQFWDVETGRPTHTTDLRATAIDYSPDGALLACGGLDKRVHLYDPTTGKPLRTLPVQSGDISAIAFSPDGKTLAAAEFFRQVWLWDLKSGKRLHLLAGHTGMIHDLGFSRDGSRLATAGGDGLVKLWDTQTGLEALTIQGHPKGCTSLAFGPQDALAAGDIDGSITIWEPGDAKKLTEESD